MFTAVAAFAFAASASIEFKSGGAVLRLADANGAVESLVAAANDAGGDDKVTVVVVDIPRLRRWLPLAALGLGLAVACAVAAATFRTEPQSQPLSSPSQVEAAPVDPLRARNETEAASRLAEQ